MQAEVIRLRPWTRWFWAFQAVNCTIQSFNTGRTWLRVGDVVLAASFAAFAIRQWRTQIAFDEVGLVARRLGRKVRLPWSDVDGLVVSKPGFGGRSVRVRTKDLRLHALMDSSVGDDKIDAIAAAVDRHLGRHALA